MPPAERISELLLQWDELREQGRHVSVDELCRDCPELLPEAEPAIAVLRQLEAGASIGCTGTGEASPNLLSVRGPPQEHNAAMTVPQARREFCLTERPPLPPSGRRDSPGR